MKFTDFLGGLFGWIAQFCAFDFEFDAAGIFGALSNFFFGK